MSKKAKHCEECIFSRFPIMGVLSCVKGHRPRYYCDEPRGKRWKRRCADFQQMEATKQEDAK